MGIHQKLFDLLAGGFVFQVGDDGPGIKDDGFYLSGI